MGRHTLTVLPAGEIPPNPAELLASARMAEILRDVRARYDMMIVDTAPLLSVVDAAVIAQNVDSTVVVVDASRTRLAQLGRALTALQSAGIELAGVIFTHTRPRRADSYYNYSSATGPSTPLRSRRRGKSLTPSGRAHPLVEAGSHRRAESARERRRRKSAVEPACDFVGRIGDSPSIGGGCVALLRERPGGIQFRDDLRPLPEDLLQRAGDRARVAGRHSIRRRYTPRLLR